MDQLLTPISQTYRSPSNEPSLLKEVRRTEPAAKPRALFKATSAEEALEVLRCEPDYDTLVSVLRFLRGSQSLPNAFRIGSPSPQAALIVQVLVTEIVPNYWVLLKEEAVGGRGGSPRDADLNLLLDCLRSLTGLNAILARLRALLGEAKLDRAEVKRSDTSLNINIVVDLICSLLRGDDSVRRLWAASVSGCEDAAKRKPLLQELLNALGGGKVISLSAEAEAIMKKNSSIEEAVWIADGKEYSSWLARNITQWALIATGAEETKLCADLFIKGFRLGHSDVVVKHIVVDLLLSTKSGPAPFEKLFGQLAILEKRRTLFAILQTLSETYLSRSDIGDSSKDAETVSAVAAVVRSVVGDDCALREHLVDWLTTTTSTGFSEGIGIRRAVMAILSGDKEALSTVLEKSVDQFGDQLYIRHAPMLQQEARSQVLLLAAGYVHRLAPMKLVLVMRSGAYLRAISNRLAASQNRARFLGMVVGEATSHLVDNKDKKLDFHMDELDSEEARRYKGIVKVSDTIGVIDALRSRVLLASPRRESKAGAATTLPKKVSTRPPMQPRTTGFVIEEVEDDESDEDDLVPYAKPDSDAEDSDEDPTMIRRDKPKAPVYVRDLVVYLRDTENYDRQQLALTTAPSLIRRKANYGTEVKEHAEELATLLVGLQDKFDMEDFYNLRLQGMIALLVAQPKALGPWFARTFFEGDYSLSQRASVLTVLGLSARELAGFETSEYASAAEFPSKRLPERVEKLYVASGSSQDILPASSLKALPPNALDSIAQSLTSSFLAPMAANAADAATGPDVLKLSSFNSRLRDKTGTVTKAMNKPRIRNIPNTTAQLISASFFYPLTARFLNAVQSFSVRTRGILFQPALLSLYLKTITLLLHAAGPSTLALPDMTTEFWGLLLGSGIQSHCVGDVTVTHAVLFGLLTLLDINEDRMRDLCRDQAREVVQTQEWVAQVFENTRGEDGGEENEVKMLAAGILIRLREGMEKYRMLLMGEMIG